VPVKAKILIVDDDPNVRTMLRVALELDYEVSLAGTVAESLRIVRSEPVDVCLLDLRLGTEDGMEALQKIKDVDSRVAIIIITAFGSISSSVEAMKLGAYSYLAKPLDIDELYMVISRALEFQRLNEQVDRLSQELEGKYGIQGIIGESAPMKKLFDQIDRVKNNDVSVVITGESGTGKELVARALHYAGRRKKERFVAINCAAIPGELLEEELFGHKKGAFTGATADTMGKFGYADGGSLFLDEVGDMPLPLQSKLLRVLETKEYFPIGSNEKRTADVRIIAATNKDLLSQVEKGTFRQDLYFRLNVVALQLPPLRERRSDIPLLVRHFIARLNKRHGKQLKGLSQGAEQALQCYDFPGNVRELLNILEHGVIFAASEYIHLCDLPENVAAAPSREGHPAAAAGRTLAEIEREAILAALRENQGHIGRSAAALGISDKGLRNKIAAYGIDAKRLE